MPGITGIIGQGSNEERRATRDRMLEPMCRERFYATGSHEFDDAGLAVGWAVHAGGSTNGNPVWNAARDVCLILTGEGFPDDSDIAALRSRGQRFGDGFAAYLVASYEEFGDRCLEKLNGTFSGVLLDRRTDKVLLFNDRFGLSRIYVHEGRDDTYFSSEAKSLLRVLPATRRLDPVGLAEYSTSGCVLQNRTLFAGISLLPPASSLTFVRGKLYGKSTYFDKHTWEQLPRLDEPEFYRRLKETFCRVVPKYFQGSSKIGMSLTGGLDGRMIMACNSRPSIDLSCYTFGSSYRDCTDVSIARDVARACGQTHEVIDVGDAFTARFAELAEQAIYVSDGAMDVTGAVELFVNQRARQIAPVRMTGNYGSEVLRSNVAFKARPQSPRLFTPEALRLGAEAAQTYAAEAQGRRLSLIVQKQVPWHHHSRLAVEQSQVTMRSPYLDNDLVALAYQAPEGHECSKTPALRFVHECNPALGRIPTDRGLLYRPTPVLTRMHNAYQELTFRAEYAYDYGMPQWLARLDHHARAWAPERVFLGRHKFYHFRVWYRDSLGDYLKDMLLDPRSSARQHVRPGSLERLLKEHLAGTHNNTTDLHQALSIELIHRQLVERVWH